ncbi:helix-turn-helix domain protein [Pseudodesulfovibrio mercurii]|uniref:Helix-turn-helix domain protein n=1 Tax=Pseudodesulfovibrio mercurii TaxID=641491 RepID=F0JDI7_9BACT|nr:XRE family transcriptional regulator [Pseudodesulfovibrio mercurii]EGB13356.1 helix-turn-helix domain protein [Pseudodesulfovibrio mercurii]
MSTEDIRSAIADRLKTCRKEREMSLDKAALLTGVSKAMLGQIERRESAPTIATLWKIASGLNLSFSSFFAGRGGSDYRQVPFPNDPDMAIRVIFPYDAATRMEMFHVTLTNGHHQRSTAHRFGVIEHVVTLRGVLDLIYEGKVHRLAQGEAHRFHADVAHQYRATTNMVLFQNIICYT